MRRGGIPIGARSVAVAVALLAVLAGCSGGGGSSTPVAASGSPAELGSDAAADTGYEHVGTTERDLNATLRVELEGDVSVTEVVDVEATVPVSRYRRSTDDGPVILAIAASPSVQVVENPPESRDPVGALSLAERVAFVQSTYGEPSSLARQSSRDAALLGAETRLVTRHGTATLGGESVDVAVHTAAADHDGDVVRAIAVAPRGAADADGLAELLREIEH